MCDPISVSKGRGVDEIVRKLRKIEARLGKIEFETDTMNEKITALESNSGMFLLGEMKNLVAAEVTRIDEELATGLADMRVTAKGLVEDVESKLDGLREQLEEMKSEVQTRGPGTSSPLPGELSTSEH